MGVKMTGTTLQIMVQINYILVLVAVLSLIYGYKLNIWKGNIKTKYIFVYFLVTGAIAALPNFTNINFEEVWAIIKFIGVMFMMWIFIHIIRNRAKLAMEMHE